MEGGVVSSEVD